MKNSITLLVGILLIIPAFAQRHEIVDLNARELLAPVHIKNKLQEIRANIKLKNLTYTVGYTEVFGINYKELTGDIKEKVTAEDAAKQNRIAMTKLQTSGINIKKSILELTGYSPEEITYNSGTSFDWREKGIMTPVKAQQGCGSCWAFGSIGSYEACYKLLNAIETDMSEQQLLNCGIAWTKPVGTCAGGTLGGAYESLLENGASKESALPYTGVQASCTNPSSSYKPVTWGWVLTDYTKYNVQDIKDALIKWGPLGVRMLIPPTSDFGVYSGGVFKETKVINDSAVGHFLVLVGWNDSKNAWLIKNSWGNGWGFDNEYSPGEKGYCWIDYKSNMLCNNTGYIVPEKVNQPNFRCSAVFEKRISGEYQVYDYNYNDFKKKYDELWPQAYRLSELSNRVVNGNVLYSAVWKPSSAPEIQVYGWNYDDFKKKYDELWPQGWRLDMLNNIVLNGKVLYTAVWHKSSVGEIQVYGWSYGDYRKKYDALWEDGWRIHILTNYVMNGQVYYSAVWRQTKGGEYQAYSNNYADFRKQYDDLWGKGFRLHTLNNYLVNGQLLYTAVWKPSTAAEVQLYNWTYVDFRNKYDMYWKTGWRLRLFNAW